MNKAVFSTPKADITLSESLLEKYNTTGPRYTSYPTAPMWQDNFGCPEFKTALAEISTRELLPVPLSLYVHLPFCEERCLFCGCNVVVTKQKDQAEKYLGYLIKEIENVSALVAPEHEVVQFHIGGGTPTYFSTDQLYRLFASLKKSFRFLPDAEMGIEADPRITTADQMLMLSQLGFNRLSMGVQDFNPDVQKAVKRIQPLEITESLLEQSRKLGFESINMDLIYGLPGQTVKTFSHTLKEIIRLNPDRIALYNFAYVPWVSPHQKLIPVSMLPEGAEKFRIMATAIKTLTQAGYIYIGMDHFAKDNDELALAQREGTLHRNFMGYTTKAGNDLIGFGVSAISGLQNHYAQNWRKLSRYYKALDDGNIPVMRGHALTDEDQLRRATINSILCNGKIHYLEIEERFSVDFKRHFAVELQKLHPMIQDGLVELDAQGVEITPTGRIFGRNIAMIFDAYLAQNTETDQPLFSRTL